jgi:hypothetical protein
MHMGEFGHNLIEKPPWAGQSVHPWVKFLAWVFLFLALLAGVAGAIVIARDGGIELVQLPAIFLFLIGELYFFVLLLHVAIKGVAPTSWLPWK